LRTSSWATPTTDRMAPRGGPRSTASPRSVVVVIGTVVVVMAGEEVVVAGAVVVAAGAAVVVVTARVEVVVVSAGEHAATTSVATRTLRYADLVFMVLPRSSLTGPEPAT
jgi:hypothetical protein